MKPDKRLEAIMENGGLIKGTQVDIKKLLSCIVIFAHRRQTERERVR